MSIDLNAPGWVSRCVGCQRTHVPMRLTMQGNFCSPCWKRRWAELQDEADAAQG